jgi:hypothetical protein
MIANLGYLLISDDRKPSLNHSLNITHGDDIVNYGHPCQMAVVYCNVLTCYFVTMWVRSDP